MTTAPATVEPPHPLFDLLLRLAPADILLFDSTLRCHYAAPVGDTFLGTSRSQLVGRHVTEILPARTRLQTALERAARQTASWEHGDYTLPSRSADQPTDYRCAVRVEPVILPDFTGVLVLLSEIGALAGERDRLRAELEALRRQEAARTEAIRRLHGQVRTQLTPVIGYLQLLVRRPAAFGGRTAATVINGLILPVLDRLVETLDHLRDLSTARPDGGVARGSHEPAA